MNVFVVLIGMPSVRRNKNSDPIDFDNEGN